MTEPICPCCEQSLQERDVANAIAKDLKQRMEKQEQQILELRKELNIERETRRAAQGLLKCVVADKDFTGAVDV